MPTVNLIKDQKHQGTSATAPASCCIVVVSMLPCFNNASMMPAASAGQVAIHRACRRRRGECCCKDHNANMPSCSIHHTLHNTGVVYHSMHDIASSECSSCWTWCFNATQYWHEAYCRMSAVAAAFRQKCRIDSEQFKTASAALDPCCRAIACNSAHAGCGLAYQA